MTDTDEPKPASSQHPPQDSNGAFRSSASGVVRSPRSDVSEGGIRLRTLVLIRWCAVIGQLFALLLVRFVLEFELAFEAAVLAVLFSAALNLYLTIRYEWVRHLNEREALLQLGFDLAQLAFLLYLTGGLQNPFAVLLVVPVTISATMLQRASTVSLLAVALVVTLLLLPFHLPLPWDGDPPTFEPIYLMGLGIALAFCMIFMALYVMRVAEEARTRATALAATQAALAREHRLSALGALAAAAAHELGTPLGTITLAAGELKRDLDDADPHAADIHLISDEVNRCRDILARLSQGHNEKAGEPVSWVPVLALIREAMAPYDKGRPVSIEISGEADGAETAQPMVFRRPEILHGLGNFIENAVSYAKSEVHLRARWSESEVLVTICDDGPGFDPVILRQLGEPYVTSGAAGPGRLQRTDGGLGLGVFIAVTLLARTGAKTEFANRGNKGAEVKVRWPREILAIDPSA